LSNKIKTVLIVDDEDFLRDVIREVLEINDINSIEAESGQKSIELAQKHQDTIDCVFLDLNLPQTTGKEVFYKLKDILPDVPFVFMSGYDQETAKDDLPENESFLYLKKPFTIMTIQNIMEKLNSAAH